MFGSRVIYSVSSGLSFSLRLVLDLLQFYSSSFIRLVSFLVYFALPFFCTLHVRSLLVILCSFPCFVILFFSVTVFNLHIKWN